MPQISKGDTFVNGEQVTGNRLNQLVDSAVILSGVITDQSAMTANTVASNDSVLLYDLSATGLRKPTIGDILNSSLPITTSSITGNGGVDLVITPPAGKKVDVAGAFEADSINIVGNEIVGGNIAVTGTATITGNVTASGTTKANLTTDSTAITQATADSSTKVATTEYVQNVKATITTQSVKRWMLNFDLFKNWNDNVYDTTGRACTYTQTGTTIVLTAGYPYYFNTHLGGLKPMNDIAVGDKLFVSNFTGTATDGIYTFVSKTATTMTLTSSVSLTTSGSCKYRSYMGSSSNFSGISSIYATSQYTYNVGSGDNAYTVYGLNIVANWTPIGTGYVSFIPNNGYTSFLTSAVTTGTTVSLTKDTGSSQGGTIQFAVL